MPQWIIEISKIICPDSRGDVDGGSKNVLPEENYNQQKSNAQSYEISEHIKRMLFHCTNVLLHCFLDGFFRLPAICLQFFIRRSLVSAIAWCKRDRSDEYLRFLPRCFCNHLCKIKKL